MNPLTNVKNIQKLNERELSMGVSKTASWHNQYKDSAWIFVGGLPYDLSEGDIITVFSQYGEVVNINLVRDKGTGKSKGYCFICYEDQRSTVLAVDNLNSIQLLKRTIRVDHVLNYKVPKEHDDEDEITKKLKNEGCAPIVHGSDNSNVESDKDEKTLKKVKKSKKKKKKKSKKNHHSSSSSASEPEAMVKVEKDDGSYDQNGLIGVSNSKTSDVRHVKNERGWNDAIKMESNLSRASGEVIVRRKRRGIERSTSRDRDYGWRKGEKGHKFQSKRRNGQDRMGSREQDTRERSQERQRRQRSRSQERFDKERRHRDQSRSRSRERANRRSRSLSKEKLSRNVSSHGHDRSHDKYGRHRSRSTEKTSRGRSRSSEHSLRKWSRSREYRRRDQ